MAKCVYCDRELPGLEEVCRQCFEERYSEATSPPAMSKKRALWQAVATVCVPSLAFWGVVFWFFQRRMHEVEWGAVFLFLFFAVLPFPLVIPVYGRYLTGRHHPGWCNMSPRYHTGASILFMIAAVLNGVSAVVKPRGTWDIAEHLALATVWFLIAMDHLRRARKRRAELREAVPSE